MAAVRKADKKNKSSSADHVVGGFVKVSTGLKGSGSSLSVAADDVTGALHYKFDFRPTREGRKSRLELSTCFVTAERFAQSPIDEKRLDKNRERNLFSIYDKKKFFPVR